MLYISIKRNNKIQVCASGAAFAFGRSRLHLDLVP